MAAIGEKSTTLNYPAKTARPDLTPDSVQIIRP
jgi:hypothetical protein